MSIVKLLGLILIFLLSNMVQSCLKNSSSKLNSYEENYNIYLYRYVSKNENNYICQYTCPYSNGDILYSDCKETYIIDTNSLDQKIIEIIKKAPENTKVNFDQMKYLANLEFKNKDTQGLCEISEEKTLLSLGTRPLEMKIVSSLSLKEKINDKFEIYEYKYNYDNTETVGVMLHNTKESSFFIKAPLSQTYYDARIYCDIATYEQILDLSSQSQDLLKYFNFQKDDCIWMGTPYSVPKCYIFRNDGTKDISSEKKHPFLCYKKEFYWNIKTIYVPGESAAW